MGGNADIDLNVKALGVINEPVKVSSPFTYSPGVASGHTTVSVGPVNLPKIPLPGGVDVTGTVKITNGKKEAVACIKMDLNVGAATEAPALETKDSPVTDCTKASDHMKNFKFSDDSTGVTTITGTLDEDVAKVDVGVDLNIKIPLVPLPEIKLDIPASISPAVKKGDLKITVGPAVSEVPDTVIDVTGNVKINDGKAEEIVCLKIGSAEAISTAANGHYEDPKDGCGSDEVSITVQGIQGAVCAPKCTSGSCPSDVPAGVTAAPQCALQDSSTQKKYCALICSPSSNDAQCGTNASCKSIQGTGLCTYDDAADTSKATTVKYDPSIVV